MRPARAAAVLLLVVASAAALRFACLRTEPWLDEVWSIDLARRAGSAGGVFLGLHDDNNNPLNTLALRPALGSGDWAAYRVLPLCAGLATIVLLGWDPEDRARGLVAAGLAAVSTHMVLYSTEARGYAPMALFSLLCFLLLRGPRAPARTAAFGLCALLAFLSHPTFVYVFAALFLKAAFETPRARRARELAVLFAPPALLFGLFELAQFPMKMDGAAWNRFWPVLLSALELWSGAPSRGAAGAAGAAALVALIGWELSRVRRERPGDFVFFAALFAGGALFAAVFPFPFERHFFACLPFALLLAAGGLTRLYRRGGARRGAAVVLALLFVLGNGARDRALAREGRGHYLEAVRRMAAETPGDAVTVAGDHDVRNRLMLDFYAGFVTPPKRFEYLPVERREKTPPDWFLEHMFQTDPRRAPVALDLRGGAHYRLVEVYPYSGLSGWMWMLYRRDGAALPSKPGT